MENNEVRKLARERGVKLWQIADALGIADTTLSKRLRYDLPDGDKRKVIQVIENLSGGDNNGKD